MKKHYQDIVDEVFGTSYKHRTLRTLFDQNSHEWTETTIDEKKAILHKILDSKLVTFEELIEGYKNYFTFEIENKKHVLLSLSETISLLQAMKQLSEYSPEAIRFLNSSIPHNYQVELTRKLDSELGEKTIFTQEILNEIVLWKVNRYASFDKDTLNLLNQIKIRQPETNTELTKKVLKSLLNTKGVKLSMASTILRFINPDIYQIIDQRAYRFLYGKNLKVPSNHDQQIDLYLVYLEDLKVSCYKNNIEFIKFKDADRVLYKIDKQENKHIPLKESV